jgi:hypothetical protein
MPGDYRIVGKLERSGFGANVPIRPHLVILTFG